MSGEIWDAPNQQVVRPDESPPWEEGTGAGGDVDGEPDPQTDDGLDVMTKDELLAEAADRGVEANASMTKDEIKAAIRAAG
jgi:hypothetical protein